jgi:hypothetical protein
MKNRILVFLVFITTILKGQSVDPETFPAVTSGVGLKYLYTNTGGEGKILVDSIATRVVAYQRNGTNGQDSLGLGGGLNQNTNIDLNGYNFLLKDGFFSGNGTASGHVNAPFNTFFMGANKPELQSAISSLSTIDGSGVIRSDISITNNTTQKGVSFAMEGDTISGNVFSQWRITDDANSRYIDFFGNDANGFRIFDTGLFDRPIFSLGSEFVFKRQGGVLIINEQIPSYADDADAGANGLIQGDVYQTNGTGSAPLNIPGIRMIKQ